MKIPVLLYVRPVVGQINESHTAVFILKPVVSAIVKTRFAILSQPFVLVRILLYVPDVV